jgi:hypothetical protein
MVASAIICKVALLVASNTKVFLLHMVIPECHLHHLLVTLAAILSPCLVLCHLMGILQILRAAAEVLSVMVLVVTMTDLQDRTIVLLEMREICAGVDQIKADLLCDSLTLLEPGLVLL